MKKVHSYRSRAQFVGLLMGEGWSKDDKGGKVIYLGKEVTHPQRGFVTLRFGIRLMS